MSTAGASVTAGSAGAPSLLAEVRSVLRRAVDVYAGTGEAAVLRGLLERLDEPLRVAIAGKVKAGKSTLLNALVGEQIAPTDASECTQIVTWYRDGYTPRATLHPLRGAPRQLPLGRRVDSVEAQLPSSGWGPRRDDGALVIDLQGTPAADVERLVVDWPSQSLRTITLIDTPGIASASIDTSARTHRFMASDGPDAAADAVLYLMRHLHATDVRFLESFHDDGHARATPVNAIGVLSRADEIGVGRIDAMFSAKRIARRYRADPQVRRLCQTVVPVAGLLAQAGMTLREREFAGLARLAAEPREDLERLLLSADRFVHSDAVLPGEERAALLGRLGVFGIRVATTVIRQGTDNASSLATQLVRRSGLEELREVLTTQFGQRRDLLKSRSALLALERAIRRDPRPGSEPLASDVERILAGAHEFTELRLLNALRSGAVSLGKEILDEAERLLGATGTAPAARLALDPDAPVEELRAAALAALERWQRRAESPLATRPVADACRVIARSCEGLLATLVPA